MTLRGIAAAAIAATVLGALPGQPKSPPDVVLVSLDTVRADHTSLLFSTEHRTTPNLEKLPGIRFQNCWAAAPYTTASHAALLSGQYRSAIHYGVPRRYFAAADTVLPEILHTAGYHTVAITAGGFMGRKYGAARGFDHFEQAKEPDSGEEVDLTRKWFTRWARKCRRERGPPLFLFVHTFVAHQPYLSTRWGSGLVERYDGDIREADVLVGLVWDLMGALRPQRNRRFIVIVVSDHGEEMGDHGHWGIHSHTLFSELLHVPCVWAEPGLPRRFVTDRVGLIDMVPTLLDRISLPPPRHADGVSLLPLMEGNSSSYPNRILFSARHYPPDQMGYRATSDEGSFIEDIGKPAAYYESNDPAERTNTWDPSDQAQQRLARAARDFRQLWTATSEKEPTYDPHTRAKLQALGYLVPVSPEPSVP